MRRAVRVGVCVAVAVVGLAALDLATGTVYRASPAASLHVTPARTGPTGRALVVFPGFAMPGDLLGEAFARYLPPAEAMIVVRYAERGVDVAAISSAVEAELARLAPREVVVYGASMGAMVAREFRPSRTPTLFSSRGPARPAGGSARRR
jgi:hypothetical protein